MSAKFPVISGVWQCGHAAITRGRLKGKRWDNLVRSARHGTNATGRRIVGSFFDPGQPIVDIRAGQFIFATHGELLDRTYWLKLWHKRDDGE